MPTNKVPMSAAFHTGRRRPVSAESRQNSGTYLTNLTGDALQGLHLPLKDLPLAIIAYFVRKITWRYTHRKEGADVPPVIAIRESIRSIPLLVKMEAGTSVRVGRGIPVHIVVCVKQVPDSREIRIDSKTGTLIREGVPSIMNPYDLHGLEAALQLKEQYGGRVTVVTMGPPMAEKTLKEAVSLGADDAVLVTDRKFGGADTLATSYVLSEAIKKAAATWGPVDMVITGKQTLDGDTGQVGPGIACRLHLEQLTYVERIVSVEGRRIRVERHLEDGVELVETSLPVLITALKEMNEVRRATLPGMIAAARYKPVVWTTQDFPDIDMTKIGLKGSPTIVAKSWVPEVKKVNTTYVQNAGDLWKALWTTNLPERLGWTAKKGAN